MAIANATQSGLPSMIIQKWTDTSRVPTAVNDSTDDPRGALAPKIDVILLGVSLLESGY
ncbi:hypothetical protein G6M89_19505 [Natronolimnobius sp. AArcel1]|uniref:hypothetical protein n=1 Tax=Natronolimnobius sp. AArcel1 TaxID=1679093 RepID=UPI0013ED8FB4|nr:hypothetical protein [Natronolimnobius sp. AArcel1]NGM71163.1 hypothetical protein [Natronolimnobius sp. AArcel1]